MTITMYTVVLVLMSMAFTGHGRRLQTATHNQQEGLRGRSRTLPKADNVALRNRSLSVLAQPHKAKEYVRTTRTLIACAKLLLQSDSPIAGWNLNTPCHKLLLRRPGSQDSSRWLAQPKRRSNNPTLSEPIIDNGDNKLDLVLAMRRLKHLLEPTPHVARSSAPIALAADTKSPPLDVRWLELDDTLNDTEASNGSMVLPIYPLEITCLPFADHRLMINEKRFRDMYNDILFSGSRRFAVVREDESTGRLAEVGVIFYLDELKDVSSIGIDEDTEDKSEKEYIGTHSVKGRVKLKKILNPRANATGETYLRAECEEIKDDDVEEDTNATEVELKSILSQVIDMQEKLEENPRFTKTVNLSVDKGSTLDNGLWETILLWHDFLEMRVDKKSESADVEVFGEILNYFGMNYDDLKSEEDLEDLFREAIEDGDFDDEDDDDDVVEFQVEEVVGEDFEDDDDELDFDDLDLDEELDLDDLPKPLADRVRVIQDRHEADLSAMDAHPYDLHFQAILQTTLHSQRLAIFRHLVDMERKRLAARAMLKAMFKSKK
mmetsp:Transcript_29335/g.54073  ORF Transcript_29335/g.54073 Transcript_29335/m.54073 type:complete len:548 (+) Transcript_29335:103-1746(+)